MSHRRYRRKRAAEMGGWGICSRHISRFLEPSLLLLLRQDPSHGHNLLDALARFGFTEGSLDPSVVYRVLREMETEGWIISKWDTRSSIPPRRIYQVTQAGKAHLAEWIDDFRRIEEELHRFLKAYSGFGNDPSETSRTEKG